MSDIYDTLKREGLEAKEPRAQIWEQYKELRPADIAEEDWTPDRVRHNFVDYDRYHEAMCIANALRERGINPANPNFFVCDYGCCAADYGIYFARLGATVHLQEIDPPAIRFAQWRFEREELENSMWSNHRGYDLAIFGEVLEHLDDPYDVMNEFVVQGTKYIFTSSYPCRTNNPDDPYWNNRGHSRHSLAQQPAVRKLLEDNYDKVNFGGEKNLWILKKK